MIETPRSTFSRSAHMFMLATPVLVAITIATHPADPLLPDHLGDDLSRYIWIHVALLALIPLLGVVISMLIRGLAGPSATAARFLLFPAVALYAAFDALVGIATGVLAREAHDVESSLLPGASAPLFGWAHPGLGGVLGMAALLVAVIAHQTHYRTEPAAPATP